MIEPIDSNGLDQFRTEQSIMAGNWCYWSEDQQKKHIRILMREGYKTKYDNSDSWIESFK